MMPIYTSEKDRNFGSSLLVILMVFSPYTELRFFSILGIPEFSLLLIIIYTVVRKSGTTFNFFESRSFIFTKFWIIFLILSLFGLVINQLFIIPPSGTSRSLLFDSATYLFLAVGLFSLELLSQKNQYDYSKILHTVFFYTSLLLTGLFIVSRMTPSVFGMNILLYDQFRPFATNIHHISMVVGPLPFIGLFLFKKIPSKKIVKRLFIVTLIISNVIIGLNTGSFKVYLGFITGVIVLVYFLVLNTIKEPRPRFLLIILLTVLILIFVALNLDNIIKLFISTFREEDIGSGREILYSSSIEKVINSPIFGYGPGAHAVYNVGSFSDAHQTFLTLLLQAGAIAFIVYLLLWIKIMYQLRFNAYLMAASMPIFIYALGGDIVRRLPMWIYLFLFYYGESRSSKISQTLDNVL